jgi:hypothetical protein
MPTLLELQSAVKDFLLGGTSEAAQFVVDDGLRPEDRLGIYRNTHVSSLVAALRISYPAVRALVGDEFFEAAARAFIDVQPPKTAYLNAYGADFGDFLAGFEPASALAYLPDVARLEWAVNVALHAKDVPPLDAAVLASRTDADFAFVPHPSVTLLRLTHPAEAIWRAVLDGNEDALTALDLSEGPVFLAIGRGSGVTVEHLTEAEWAFSEALFSGVTLLRALKDAFMDMSPILARHLAAGRFTAIRTSPERANP